MVINNKELVEKIIKFRESAEDFDFDMEEVEDPITKNHIAKIEEILDIWYKEHDDFFDYLKQVTGVEI